MNYKTLIQKHQAPNIHKFNIVCTGQEDKSIRLIPIPPNQKYPQTKNWSTTIQTPEQLTTHQGNYGIMTGWNHDSHGYSLACIDIDGLTIQNQKIPGSTEYLFQTLWKHIKGDKRFEVHKSPNGYHIFCWNKTQANYTNDNDHYTSTHLKLPSEEQLPDELKEYSKHKLENSIEIFTHPNRQIVLGGSTVDGFEYEILQTGVIFNPDFNNTIEDINEWVKKVLLESGFTWIQDAPIRSNTKTIKSNTPNNIQQITQLIQTAFTKLQNSKHTNVLLPLSHYLSQHIDIETAETIINKITETIQFKNNTKTKKDFLREWNPQYRTQTNKTGLPTLIQKLNETVEPGYGNKWAFQLEKALHNEYRFKNKDETIILDYNTCTMRTEKEVLSTLNDIKMDLINYAKENKLQIPGYKALNKAAKEGYYEFNAEHHWQGQPTRKTQKIIAGFVIDEISLRDNIMDKKASSICEIKYTINTNNKKIQHIATDKNADVKGFPTCVTQIRKDAGAVLTQNIFPDLMNKITHYFRENNLINFKIDVPVPGIFIHPEKHEIVRSKGEGSINIEEDKPTPEQVQKALQLLKDLYEWYKGDKTKITGILRYCLTSPYSFIRKEDGEPIPSLFIHGASRTAKTTLSQIGMLIWTPINELTEKPGSTCKTPAQYGRAVSQTGTGIIINECESLVGPHSEVEDLIKINVDNKIIRKPGYDVYGYSNVIYTSNVTLPEDAAIVRRSTLITMTSQERFNNTDYDLFNERYNFNGNINTSKFKILHAIGDYITYYSTTIPIQKLLLTPIEDLRNIFIKQLIEYAQLNIQDYTWFLQPYEDTRTMEEADQDIVEDIRNIILTTINQYKSKNIEDKLIMKNNESMGRFSKPELTNEEWIKGLSDEGILDYIVYDEEKQIVGITARIKNEARKQRSPVKMNVEAIAGLLNRQYVRMRINGGTQKRFILFDMDNFFTWINTGELPEPNEKESPQ